MALSLWDLTQPIKVLPANRLKVGDYVHPYQQCQGGIVTEMKLAEKTDGYEVVVSIDGRITNIHLGSGQMVHVTRPRDGRRRRR